MLLRQRHDLQDSIDEGMGKASVVEDLQKLLVVLPRDGLDEEALFGDGSFGDHGPSNWAARDYDRSSQ